MKKLFLLPLLCLSWYASAQGTPDHLSPDYKKPNSVTIGAYLGVNNCFASNAMPAPDIDNYNGSGLFGVYGIFKLSEKLSLEAGLGWIGYGAKYLRYSENMQKHDTLFYRDHIIKNMNYVTVPLILKYGITPKSSITGGVRFSGNVGGNQDLYRSYILNNMEHVIMVQPELTDRYLVSDQFDLGLIIGYEYAISQRLSLSLMANLGLVPIISNADRARYQKPGQVYLYPTESGNFNNSIGIRLCYNFILPDKIDR